MTKRQSTAVAIVTLLVCVGTLIAVWITSAARSRARCKQNLTSLGLAFHEYHEQHGHFPAAYSENAPAHSWRVELLPFFGNQALYDSYVFGEAWDSSANKRLLQRRPEEYGCPEITDPTETSYVGVVGIQTAWPYYESTGIDDLLSGSSMSILVMDIHDAKVPWTKPTDPTFAEAVGSQGEGWAHGPGYTNVLMADGATHSIAADVDPKILSAMLSPNNGRLTTDNPRLMEKFIVEGVFKPAVAASSLPATTLSPVAEVGLRAGRSMLYCPTFVLACVRCSSAGPICDLRPLASG